MILCLCPVVKAPSVVLSLSSSFSNFFPHLFDRPHPVKPMSSAENQFPSGAPVVKEIRILDSKAAQIKVPSASPESRVFIPKHVGSCFVNAALPKSQRAMLPESLWQNRRQMLTL